MDLSTLPEIDWTADEFQSDVGTAVEAIAPLQSGSGMVRSQRGLELVTYDAVVKAMRDPRIDSGMEIRLESAGVTSGTTRAALLDFLTNREGVDHIRARRACAPWFSASGAEKLRATTREWVEQWLDDAAAEADDFDLLTGISNRLPATLFCLMMGTPPTDAPFIQHMSEEHLLLNAPPHPGKGERIEAAVAETIEYLRAAIEDRRQNPGDDLLSFMVAAEERGEVDVQDILTVAHNALVGSTDTTSTQICLSLQALAEHPDQWAILKDEPERVPHAVMELLRYNPGPWAIRRAPMHPLEYEGIAMGPEDSIWASIYAANNDPTVFEDPRRLDVTREHPKMPLNFGSGRHGCLGRMVTLMEQQEVLWAVLRRWESFEVLGARFTGAMFNSVVREFRVRFVPTRI